MMTREQYLSRLRLERDAFEAKLPELLREYANQVVVFHDGTMRGAFPTYSAAYSFALTTFGLSEPFLIEPVAPPRVETIWVAWDSGVMFASATSSGPSGRERNT